MSSKSHSCQGRRYEQGSALLISVMILVLMAAMGFAALETTVRDRQTAGFQSLQGLAFYAADAGVAQGMNLVRIVDNRATKPPLPATDLGDAASYALYSNQPRYRGDPSVADPIAFQFDGGAANGMNLAAKPEYVKAYWLIRVSGQLGVGAESRLEAMTWKVMAPESEYR